jgi:hypothetical protein
MDVYVCVCVCKYMYIYTTHTYRKGAEDRIRTGSMYGRECVFEYVRINAHTCIFCIYMCVYIYIYIHYTHRQRQVFAL